ncbi:MAG: hypothetical protein KIT60_03555 [Burkholderiaceae bacterium]|nr:hypothetical protein [Burkholderiaceae bacterium]
MLLLNATLPQAHDQTTRNSSEQLSRAITAIASAYNASGPCDLLASLFQATRAFGVRESAYAHVIPDPEAPPRVMVLLAFDPLRSRMHRHFASPLDHPWLRYARDHVEPVLASTLHNGHRVHEESLQLGLLFDSVFIIPTHSGGNTGRYGALMLDTATEGYGIDLSACRLMAHSLARELHDWWMRRTRAELQRAARLRSEDVRLLAFERQGLSTKQIARLVDSSITAVDSRFRRINAKIGASNRRHAATRAAIHGLL